jgi:hypothetical protein
MHIESRWWLTNRQMREYSQSNPGRESGETSYARVYVIFRVYNLGQESIGVKILVDPWGMRQKLVFEAENYSVKPSM